MLQSLNWLDDEEVEFEKTCTKGLLSAEDIEKLRFDESLSEKERALLIFSDGQETQRISLAHSLPSLLLEEPEAVSELISCFVDMVNSASSELLIACGKCVKVLASTGLIFQDPICGHITPLIWTHVSSHESEVENIWLDALVTYIRTANLEHIRKNNIVNMVLAKGNLSEKTSSRIACSKLITSLCLKLDTAQVALAINKYTKFEHLRMKKHQLKET